MHQVIEFYEQNLRLAQQTGDQRGESAALNSLGTAYDALGEREKAVACYEQALQIARQVGDARGERLMLKKLNDGQEPAGKGETADSARQRTKPQKRVAAKTKSGGKKATQRRQAKSAKANKKPRPSKNE